MSVTTPDLNISFEGHLADTLAQLRDVLPNELASQLAVYLAEPRPKTIPYSFIHAVSQWVRTPAGSSKVSSPNDYSMVALLAGTTTSPERKFGTYVPPPDPDAVAAHASQERKQITTLINGVLSVGGSAMAALWASEHTGWKYEWRVLFSFFVAIVVAISEAVLYIIWQSRRDASKKRRPTARHKKDDGDRVGLSISSPPSTKFSESEDNNLRHRIRSS